MPSKPYRFKMKDLPPCPPCWVCGALPSEWDHIQTRGSGGGDEPENRQPLCRKHHTEKGAIGIKTFAQKYHLPIDVSGIYPRRTDLD